LLGVSAYTLRYYDKEGLLPNVERVNGRRIFREKDLAWLKLLNCLKNTGMPLKDIHTYLELCQLGDSSLQDRLDIVLKHKQSIEDQIASLQLNLKEIEYKVWYYQKAIEFGSESIHTQKERCTPEDCKTTS
jgi:DNA-binding transcriptional MerR regulator